MSRRVDEARLWRGNPEATPERPVAKPAASMAVLPENLDTDLLATWWVQRTMGTIYWRANVPARELRGRVLQLRTNDLQPAGDQIAVPRQRSRTAVWQFPGNATRGIIMRGMQLAGFRVLVEVDDNYLVTTTHQDAILAAGGGDWQRKVDRTPQDKHSQEAHRRLCEFADGVIVTTETLAAAYRGVNGNVHVCRNSVDVLDWPVPEKPADGVFRVGYAASASHLYDAADIDRALSWAAAQPGVEVLIYGLRRDWSFPHVQVPWTNDLTEYRRSLAALDVGLCPLRSSVWADAKSDVKLLEYSMAEAATVVSRTPPYGEWHDTDCALTADTPKDFLRHVKWLVKNQDASREMAARAKQRILETRTIQHEIHRWRAAVA